MQAVQAGQPLPVSLEDIQQGCSADEQLPPLLFAGRCLGEQASVYTLFKSEMNGLCIASNV